MYNGIGLPTPRGSGTNGYVQKNLAHVPKSRLTRPDIVAKPDSQYSKPPSSEVLTHQKKREIESKCLQLRKELEEEGWRERDIEDEVNHYRKRKLRHLAKSKESDHSDRLKRSFGLREDYVDGSAVTQIKRSKGEVKEEVKKEETDVKKEIKKEVKKERRKERTPSR